MTAQDNRSNRRVPEEGSECSVTRVGIVGMGPLGRAFARGLQNSSGFTVSGYVRRRKEHPSGLGRLQRFERVEDLRHFSEVLFLCVSPSSLKVVLDELVFNVSDCPLLLSFVVGGSPQLLEHWNVNLPIAHVMPSFHVHDLASFKKAIFAVHSDDSMPEIVRRAVALLEAVGSTAMIVNGGVFPTYGVALSSILPFIKSFHDGLLSFLLNDGIDERTALHVVNAGMRRASSSGSAVDEAAVKRKGGVTEAGLARIGEASDLWRNVFAAALKKYRNTEEELRDQ